MRFARGFRALPRLVIAACLVAACSSDTGPGDAPSVGTISNDTFVQGTTTTVIVTGTHFVDQKTTITVSGTGVTIGNLVVNNPTMLTVTVTVAPDAQIGARSVTVQTASGVSGTLTLTVKPAAPTLASVAPGLGVQGATATIALTGTNFISGATTVSVSGADVTAQNVRVTNATSITVDVVVGASAALGARTISVTTAGGTSGTQSFTINPPTPTLASVSTAGGIVGTTVTETLTGTNFVAGATVTVSGAGVSASQITVVNPTTITATFTVDGTATLGVRGVTVTTAGGTSGTAVFAVNPAAPTISAVSPGVGVQGTATTVTITGTNFVAGFTTLSVSGAGITVTALGVVNSTTLMATLSIDAFAPLGARTVTVTNAGGTTATAPFTVLPPMPLIVAIDPVGGSQRSSVAVTLTGINFVSGSTVSVGGSGVTVDNIVVVNATTITARFTVAVNAGVGDHDVTVTSAGGQSLAFPFRVYNIVPFIATITPASGSVGLVVPVTIAGANYSANGTTVTAGPGIIVGAVTLVNTATLQTTFTITGAAALGARDVTVTTANGTSNVGTFTVGAVTPALASVTPSLGVQGTTQSVTLTGTSFVGGATTVAVSGTGVTATNVNVTNGTTLTADLVIAGGATLGVHDVTVTTPGGTSGTQAFTILPPLPTLASVAPPNGVQGTTQTVTLTGTNFVAGATTVNVSGTNVTAGNVNVTTATSLTADLAIGAGATLGARTVSVTTAGGTSGTQAFTINPPTPTLASVSPNTGAQTGSQTITLTGTNFQAGATTVNVSGGNVTVSSVNVTSGTSLTATFAVDLAATTTARSVTVTTAGGTSGAQPFTVVAAPVINTFAALSTHVTLVQPTQLTWTTTSAATCSINSGVGSVGCSTSAFTTPGATTTYTLSATSAGATATANTTVFANEPGRWVFTSASTDNQLRMFSLNATTGDLAPIGGGTVASGTRPYGVAVDPAGQYAYAINILSNNVSMYKIDATIGALTSNGTIATGTDPVQIAVDPTGRYAYAVNRNQAGTSSVSAYTINASGQLVTNGAAVAAGTTAIGIAIDPTGRYVYVANRGSGSIQAYAISPTGTLSSLGTIAEPNAMYVAVDPTGRFVYVSNNTFGTISEYTINSNGTLTSSGANLSVGSGTYRGITVDPTGRFAYMVDFNNSIYYSFSINQTTGRLTSVAGLGLPGNPLPEMIAVDPQGKFAYTANSGNNTVSIFTIDQTTGALTLLRSVAAGSLPLGIVVSR